MKSLTSRQRMALVLCGAVTVLGVCSAVYVAQHTVPQQTVRDTTGDIEVSHSSVTVNGKVQRGIGRVGPGDIVQADGSGRARLRLVEGVTALLDVSTQVTVGSGRLSLGKGRLFVDSPEGQVIEFAAGEARAKLAGCKTAIAYDPAKSELSMFTAQGEVMVESRLGAKRVTSGESLHLSANAARIEPEKAFDDWTAGLAVPWETRKLTRSALPEVWSFTDSGEPEAQLHVSQETLKVTLDGEFAVTEATTVYYNGRERSIEPELRVALPPKAQLDEARFALSGGGWSPPAQFGLCQTKMVPRSPHIGFEWGGGGWLLGKLPRVGPGQSVTVRLRYSEWLDADATGVTYRQPFAKGSDSPIIGELALSLDAERTYTTELETNRGAYRNGRKVSMQSADTRMTDDWVTRYQPSILKPKQARAYVETASDGSDPYLMVRLETPTRADCKVRLAIVIDVSESVGAAGLELARKTAEALLRNLSEKDSAVLLAADEEVLPLGSLSPTPATEPFRRQMSLELGKLRPGGATNLGRAIEQAADVLDGAHDSSEYHNAIIYLGDGKPTLGDLNAEQLRGRLARRASGMPRLSAVAVGGNADLWQLSRIASTSGQVFAVTESIEASVVAARAVRLLSQPSYTELEVGLGTTVDRSYPRASVEVFAGETFSAYGRLRGAIPKVVKLSFNVDGKRQSLEYPLVRIASPEGADVARRWAEQRVRELAQGTDGLAAMTRLAQEHRLLTPWSGWFFENSSRSAEYSCTEFDRRLVELTTQYDMPYASRIIPRLPPGTGFLEPKMDYDAGTSIERAVVLHAQSVVESAVPAMVVCRDSRLASVRALPANLKYNFVVSRSGRAEQLHVEPTENEPVDMPLQRCVERVLKSKTYIGGEQPTTISEVIHLPNEPRNRKSSCSVAAKLPLELRRSVWMMRTGPAADRYTGALESCELPTWTDRKALLDILFAAESDVKARLGLASSLGAKGQSDGADYVKRRVVDAVQSLSELAAARQFLLENEPNLDAVIAGQVRHCQSDAERLTVLRKVLLLAPHSPLGRRLLLLLLERMGDIPGLLREAEAIRRDPFADAGLVARTASALRRADKLREARRSFSGLFERAPNDPWVLAFAGDELRYAGLYEEAVAAYESLSAKRLDDASTLLRLALAQAGAARLDISTRLLDRAIQIGGRSDDERIHELSAIVRAMILAKARQSSEDKSLKAELTRRLAETPLPDLSAVVLLDIGVGREENVVASVYRGGEKSPSLPDFDASAMGLSGVYVERGTSQMNLKLSRAVIAGMARPLPVVVQVLRLGVDNTPYQWSSKQVLFAADSGELEIPLDQEISR